VLEYGGRRDLQVKVRGFRVEVGEIEAVLKQHGSVKQAVVTAREDGAGRKRLVAYIIAARTSIPPASAELRRHLKHKLPEYMIPSLFVRLDALPLTNSGKVDRRALPAPEPDQEERGEEYVAPRSVVEEMLASIWSEVLGGVKVGVNDNFFDLGGHSLLATQVMSRVREAFGIEIALRSLFEQPTVEELAETIAEGLRAELQVPPRIERAKRDGNLMPLSFAQQRLWFLDKLEQDSSFYNLSSTVRISGATLDVGALEKSLREVTQRHEILRTTFTVIEGQPMQVISPESHFSLPLSDLSQLPPAQRDAEAQRLAHEEALRPFDLSTGPLVRARLLRLSPEEHILLLSMHHIVSDGWSMGVLIREMAALYEAYAAGAESPLEELNIQYGDFAVWQREWLRGEVLDQQLAYWRKQLAGVPPVLALPTDHPRPAVKTFNGAAISLNLPRSLSEKLKALTRREGVTLFMSLLAAFQVLLQRYSGQEDIAVGTPVAHRTRAETEELIGFFVNTLVLRTDVSGNPTFRELVQRVKETALGAYAHQDVPFEKLVEELAPERNLSVTPLFQAMFAMQNTPSPEIKLRDLQLSLLETARETAKFDIVLVMWETAEGLEASLEYSTDLYKEATMQRLLRQFQTLLEGVVADPSARISELPLLTASEQQRLIDWNNTQKDFPQELCFHQLFESQVELSPHVLALVFDEQQITYQELNCKANQLAHHLRDLGVGPETVVAVCMERSIEMVVGLLGILKAGGAYIPLDPTYPKERLTFMLNDAGAAVVLTQTNLKEALPELETALVCLDADWPRIAQHSEQNPITSVDSQNLAYVIYTSGSTGEPKGVQVQHRSVVNLCKWHQGAYDIGPKDRATQVARLVSDASVWEIWPYLTVGASVYFVDEWTLASPGRLVQWLAKNQITISFLPTPLAHAVLQESWPPSTALRTMLTGGDVLRRITEAPLSFKLVKNYGPTENTVVATWGEVETSEARREPSIGRPIDNTQVHILDRKLGAVPIGVTGEIYIGGAGLARGYLNRADLTAARFIPDPFSGRPGARLYQTGDLGSYLEDGRIEFCGRADEQVKIIPASEASPPAPAASYLAPATELERRIAEIWQDVLGVDRIGMHDNFFELGGNSLALVLMNVRLNETLGREVSTIELFRHPTITLLAAHVGQDQHKNSVDTSNRRRAAERREALKERMRPR
jgi:amino acid adenylation domain-containing protein